MLNLATATKPAHIGDSVNAGSARENLIIARILSAADPCHLIGGLRSAEMALLAETQGLTGPTYSLTLLLVKNRAFAVPGSKQG